MTTEPSDQDRLDRLRQIVTTWADPPPEMIAKLPRAGTTLDYVGHADVTLALIDVDPEWTLDLGWDTSAGPVDPFAMGKGVLLARMTVLGVTRPCVGTIEDRKVDTESALKELLSDAIRNGAMRFGIATGLWSKSQRAGHDPDEQPGRRGQRREAEPWTVAMMKAKAVELALGDVSLGQQAYELAVGLVDSDTTFPEQRVVELVRDMQQWLDTQAATDIANPHDGAELTT